MIVKELEQMEKIVSSNKSLSWDGWTVISSYPSERGRTSKDGKYINSKWHMQNRFEPTRSGWNIPSKFVG